MAESSKRNEQLELRWLGLHENGLQFLDSLGRHAAQSSWVGLGTFGLATDLVALRCLPKGSSIIVGLPREAEKHSTILLKLRVLKKAFPLLQLIVREDFHAKYALFEKKDKSRLVLIGSANTTASPAIEAAVLLEGEGLYKRLLQKHTTWAAGGKNLQPDQTPKLDGPQLLALKSLAVDSKQG